MGSKLTNPITRKNTAKGVGPDYRWALSSIQGWKVNMNDFLAVVEQLADLKGYQLFIVADGHYGSRVARRVIIDLPHYIYRQIATQMTENGEYNPEDVKKAIQQAILEFDEDLGKEPGMTSIGSTVSGVLVTPTEFFFMNLGTSGASLCRNQELYFSTVANVPSDPQEEARIRRANGLVLKRRIFGRLKFSRAIGHFGLKRDKELSQTAQLVSALADVTVVKRNQETDDFIAIYTDGVTHQMSSTELTTFITKRIECKRNLEELNEEILDFCCHQKSKDNITLVILHFNGSNL